MPAKICLHFRVLRDLCGEKMGTEFVTIYLVELPGQSVSRVADFRNNGSSNIGVTSHELLGCTN